MDKERKIFFHKDYFMKFYSSLNDSARSKIDYVLLLIKKVSKVPVKFLKHVEGTKGLYEIRVEYQSNIFRIFCCFDKGNLVILFNGFTKKSNKTPKKEIDLAISLMKEYFKNEEKKQIK